MPSIFTRIVKGEIPAYKILEDDRYLAFLDLRPVNPGHTLVIPTAPARTILDIEADPLARLAIAVQRVARGVRLGMAADGLTIQQFNESAGGQVVFHLHVHIIPRWDGSALRPHSAEMAPAEQLMVNAEKIKAALAAS